MVYGKTPMTIYSGEVIYWGLKDRKTVEGFPMLRLQTITEEYRSPSMTRRTPYAIENLAWLLI